MAGGEIAGEVPSAPHRFQEQLYRFPYHFIPAWDGRFFSQVQSLHWGYEYLSYLHFVLDRLTSLEFASVLDVGCGDGRFLGELRRLRPEQRLVGIDLSAPAIQWARGCNPDVEWVHGDVTDERTLPTRFDVITLIETLEHIPKERLLPFLEALRRRLHDDGVLMITVPTTNVPVNVHHVQHFDLEGLRELLDGRFVVERVDYLNRNCGAWRWFFRAVLHNGWFIVHQKHLLSLLFRAYRRRLLVADARSGRRIFLSCRVQGPR